MPQSVYIETSIIGYLASRPNADVVFSANKLLTSEWWINQRNRFELFVSQAVIDECSSGDPIAAGERLAFLAGITVLEIEPAALQLAAALLTKGGLPAKAAIDATNIAVAALNRIDYLLTWNCKHIANPALRGRIEQVLEENSLPVPVICTPQEFLYV